MLAQEATQTLGGFKGHLLRRLIHLFSFFLPLIYYFLLNSWQVLAREIIVIIFLFCILLFELLRLKNRWIIYGQRSYEQKYISSFAWSAVSVSLVLLLAPGAKFGIPIIWSWALADPLLGELRSLKWSRDLIFLLGVIAIALVWLVCYFLFGTAWWFIFIMPPLMVLAEWPNFKWIDDSVLMQGLPLILILIMFYLLGLG